VAELPENVRVDARLVARETVEDELELPTKDESVECITLFREVVKFEDA
jgi:hypothetical protein